MHGFKSQLRCSVFHQIVSLSIMASLIPISRLYSYVFLSVYQPANRFSFTFPSIEMIRKFCCRITLPDVNDVQMAFLLAIAQCTGWSAERIGIVFHTYTNILVSGQEIYKTHQSWVESRGSDDLKGVDLYIAHSLLAVRGICVRPLPGGSIHKPLNRTEPLVFVSMSNSK